MNPNLKIIAVILITFIVAIATSMLLELSIFKHWLRQSIVVLMVLIEIIIGFFVFKSIFK